MEIDIQHALDIVAGRISDLQYVVDTTTPDGAKCTVAKIQLHEAQQIFDRLSKTTEEL